MGAETTAEVRNSAYVTVFIGVGANLDNPKTRVSDAFNELGSLPDSELTACSGLYQSAPMGPQDQNDYINAVVRLSTKLEPLALLDELQRIEKEQGRVRKAERWGPRTLDLDLLLYNNSNIEHPRLTVPHYGMHERNFVLLPLAEIEPDLKLPNGTAIRNLINQLDQQGIQRL